MASRSLISGRSLIVGRRSLMAGRGSLISGKSLMVGRSWIIVTYLLSLYTSLQRQIFVTIVYQSKKLNLLLPVKFMLTQRRPS
jgi:hypothetical protein